MLNSAIWCTTCAEITCVQKHLIIMYTVSWQKTYIKNVVNEMI